MSARRANIGGRVAVLEERAKRANARCRSCAAVTVFLPRKDGNDRPLGTEAGFGGATIVWYQPEHQKSDATADGGEQ